MATTKQRVKTSMKNKTKLWRRMAVKGYGRKLRNAMNGYNHPATITTQLAGLFKRAGIDTPEFDKRMNPSYNEISKNEGEVA